MSDIFSNVLCTYYKHYICKDFQEPGKTVPMLDVLSKEGYTNGKLLNELRLNGKSSLFYKEQKKHLSAACFSSLQDNLSAPHSDKNHLCHTKFIQFDIDTDGNPSLLMPGGFDEMKNIISDIPHVAYLGASVSQFGLWGLIPILNGSNHDGHYLGMIEYFKQFDINLDKSTASVSDLRFVAYDPDAYFNLDAIVFELTGDVINNDIITMDELPPRKIESEEIFLAACRWIEVKHGLKFQQGMVHNYLLCLYSTLRMARCSRSDILNWIYNNLIEADRITTNCLDEIKFKR